VVAAAGRWPSQRYVGCYGVRSAPRGVVLLTNNLKRSRSSWGAREGFCFRRRRVTESQKKEEEEASPLEVVSQPLLQIPQASPLVRGPISSSEASVL